MEPALAPPKANPWSELPGSYPLIDVIEVRVFYGAPAPGFILVPEGLRVADADALVGQLLLIEPPGGWAILGKIAGARDHGTTTSLLVEHWPTDFPTPRVGWRVEIATLGTTSWPRPTR